MNAKKTRIPKFLFHGTSSSIEDFEESGLIAQIGKWTESVFGSLHNCTIPAVWLTDKAGMAYHYAVNNHVINQDWGTILVIETSGLDMSKFILVDPGYAYPINDNGDEDHATHYAYAGNIPADAIIDQLPVDGTRKGDFDEALDLLDDY